MFRLFYSAGVNLAKLTPVLLKGKGGKAGSGGTPGKGGKSGPPGVNIVQCLPALGSADGHNGRSCYSDKEGGISQAGQDGIDGYYYKYVITAIPQVPGLWP